MRRMFRRGSIDWLKTTNVKSMLKARPCCWNVGPELSQLDSELRKLAGASEERINAKLVKELVAKSSSDEVWALQEAVLSGDPRRTAQVLHEVLDIGRKSTVPAFWCLIDLAASWPRCRSMPSVVSILGPSAGPSNSGTRPRSHVQRWCSNQSRPCCPTAPGSLGCPAGKPRPRERTPALETLAIRLTLA